MITQKSCRRDFHCSSCTHYGRWQSGLYYKRVDRILKKNSMQMLAMEDFCQLDLRLTQDKYKGSYECCAKIIDRYSSRNGLDMTEQYLLSHAYDLLPINVIMPEDKEQFTLAMNGKMNICRKDFLEFADECGVSRSSAERMIAMIVSQKEKFISMCNSSLMPDHLKGSFVTLIEERMSVFMDKI